MVSDAGLSVGKGLARARGFALLGALALMGWALLSIAPLPLTPKPEVAESDNGSLALLLDGAKSPNPSQTGSRGRTLLILSKVPFDYDPGRSLLTFRTDQAQRIIPGGARTVMVHSDRRIEASPGLTIPLSWLEALKALPASLRGAKLKDWLQDARTSPSPGLFPPDERLCKFWLERP